MDRTKMVFRKLLSVALCLCMAVTMISAAAYPAVVEAAQEMEWDGTLTDLSSGIYYIPKGKTVTTKGLVIIGENAVLRVEGSWILQEQGEFSLLGSVQCAGGEIILESAYEPCVSYVNPMANLESITLKSGRLHNKGGSVGRVEITGAATEFINYDGASINSVLMTDGWLSNDQDGSVIEDVVQTGGTLYNCAGGTINNIAVQSQSQNNNIVFDNYKGGIVEKLTVSGDAGYNIYNRNAESGGVPVIRELYMDPGYYWVYNDYNGRIDKVYARGEGGAKPELVNNYGASIGQAFMGNKSVVSNRTYTNQNTNTTKSGTIEELYLFGEVTVDNLGEASIGSLYANVPSGYTHWLTGITDDSPDAGAIGSLYYKIEKQPDTADLIQIGQENTVALGGIGNVYGRTDSYDGVYGVYGEDVRLTPTVPAEIRNNTNGLDDVPLESDGAGGFILPVTAQNAWLSARVYSGDATLSGFTYRIDGGEPIEVPGFAPSTTEYTLVLPRTVSPDARISLDGTLNDPAARVKENVPLALSFGTHVYENPAYMTIQAEDGSENTYKVRAGIEPDRPNFEDSSVKGLENGAYRQNEKPVITAVGAGMDNQEPVMGDVRYIPAAWQVDNGKILAGTWGQKPYTSEIDMSKLSIGEHTLSVTFSQQMFGELSSETGNFGWGDTGEGPEGGFVIPVAFTVKAEEKTSEYTLTVENGTGSGVYPAGEKVTIKADTAPAGKVFDKWVLGKDSSGKITSTTRQQTTFTMGEGDATVTATYKNKTSGTGGTGDTGNKTTTVRSPKTGDASMSVWMLMAFMMGSGALAAVLCSRRRRKNK
ncbi:LPXTG cell wall anchor domain-containing protein [Ruminococcus sp. OA3]|uniref:InlB B-repeat-containing protein n=1 Tax=Ruminococcus sp. OA3 TaxID=2914164 RepID=UPI001F0552A3|nr:LPXTG cell wall anchor domain-containing protein [Ruminococcus sp. OA3]MCH1981979.1 LPXTG cell wall anchor domain-containing protein [Ruminococcus sp. OA3]